MIVPALPGDFLLAITFLPKISASAFIWQRPHAVFDCFFPKFQLFLVEILSRDILTNVLKPARRLVARVAGNMLAACDAFAPLLCEVMLKLLSFFYRHQRLCFDSANQSRSDDAGFFFAQPIDIRAAIPALAR